MEKIMTDIKNGIIVHAAGGAGISIADKALKLVNDAGEGFAKLTFSYVDMSRANIDKIQPEGPFWQVKSKDHTAKALDGSGGIRGANIEDKIDNINDYLDKGGYKNRVVGEYHLVVFSASGGTGSMLGPLIVRCLLERNIPVIIAMVGDDTDGTSAINILDTFATVSNIAKKNNKPVSCIYINNAAVDGASKNSGNGEVGANNIIYSNVLALSLFLSGQNESIDNQDMNNIIDQSAYTKLPIAAGVYGLILSAKKQPVIPAGCYPTGARTLVAVGDNVDDALDITLLHRKKGFVTAPNAIKIYSEQFPIHMISVANILAAEEESLHKAAATFKSIVENISTREHTGFNGSAVHDSGLVY